MNAMDVSSLLCEALFERSAEGVLVLDLQSGTPIRVNPALCSLSGYSAAELLELPWSGTPTRAGLVEDPGCWEALQAGGSQPLRDIPCRRKDGSRIRCDLRSLKSVAGGAELLIIIFRDRADQARSEERNRQWAKAVEQSTEAILITDREGCIEYVNPAFERISGYSSEEVIGRKPSLLKSGAHEPAFYSRLWAQLANGEPWKGRFINRRKDQRLFHEEATISPVFDDRGTVTHFVAVKRDVTRETTLEDQLAQTQKQEAIGRLAASVAHDFNNILTAILGYAECLLATMDEDDKRLIDVREILKASERASDLTKQLSSIARKHTLSSRSVINPNSAVEGADAVHRRLAGEKIQVEYQLEPNPWSVRLGVEQLSQLLAILVTNARDAMPNGGTLRLETRNVTFDAEAVEEALLPTTGEHVLIAVSDTGIGIPPAVQNQIFEPFFTTKPAGTGLGLSALYGIVRQNSGIVQFESAPGQGTTFKLFFPRAENPAAK